MQERRTETREAMVDVAFDLARNQYEDPRLLEALVYLSRKADGRAPAPKSKSTSKKKRVARQLAPAEKDGLVSFGSGIGVGGTKEVIDYLFLMAWGDESDIMGFWALPPIDGGVVAVLTTCAIWISRQSKRRA